MYPWLQILCLVIVLPTCLSSEQPLSYVEPLLSLNYEILPRSNLFYQKRHLSPAATAAAAVLPSQIQYDDHLLLNVKAYNTTFQLNLEPNLDLFHPTAEHHRHLSAGFIGAYKGHVQSSSVGSEGGGWARVIIRYIHGEPVMEGAFRVEKDLYHIKTKDQYELVKRTEDPNIYQSTKMVIYKEDGLLEKRDSTTIQQQCGFDNNMVIPSKDLLTGGLLSKRFEQGCPITKKINYMGAAADCTYVQYYKSKDAARVQIINNFNMASAIFEETFNIALGLINITMMDPTCPTQINSNWSWNRVCDANYSLVDRLSDFSLWRSSMKHDGAGLWHLMTNCPTGVEVGLAWLKQLCNTSATTQKSKDGKQQYVSGAGVSAITRDEWKVVAHEIGHGFGAIHDCTADSCPCIGDNCQCCPKSSNSCPSEGFLMSPISNASAEHFSPCSIHTICSSFPVTGHCLSDPQDHAKSIYQLNVCGNGIKEPGEECDTGGLDTACCDASTCKLKPNAVCDDFNDTCCDQCQIRPSTHMCRPAATPCDISEYCTGQSATCPNDVYLEDGISCESGKQCASGQCTSRDAQCLSRGYVMNITQSCKSNHDECKMLCNKPSGQCLLFSGNFIDGTPCGEGGRCFSGTCNQDGLNESLSWVKHHLQIVIPVSVIVFLIICGGSIFVCWWYGYCGCTGYKKRRNGETKMSDQVPKKESGMTMVPSPSAGSLEPTSAGGVSASSLTTMIVNNDIIENLKIEQRKNRTTTTTIRND